MKLLECNQLLNKFIDDNKLRDEADIDIIIHKYGLHESIKLKADLEEIENTNRVLRVGIIGRVKAGKSSLLNALIFDGNDVLPKAATPMTAALTCMAYTKDKIRAEIDFYSDADIAGIKANANKFVQIYKNEIQKCIAEQEKKSQNLHSKITDRLIGKNKQADKPKYTDEMLKQILVQKFNSTNNSAFVQKDIEDKAYLAMSAYPELQSCFDQNMRIEKSARKVSDIRQQAKISAKSTQELVGKLTEYVGANGSYMPFTKAVTLYLPEKGLMGLEIVDTPGVNDPVASREERTKEFLAKCDVVLVVSPSGQFLSQEDMDLMARVTCREGIEEAYLISSQIDNQLFGGEKQQECNPNKVLEKITNKLYAQATQVLNKQAEIHPEMNKIVELYKKNKVVCTSSVAYTLWQKFNDRGSWDEMCKHVWANLCKSYPDFFSDKNPSSVDSLQKISNIGNVQSILAEIKTRKTKIQQEKSKKFCSETLQAYKGVKKELLLYFDAKIASIEDADIDDLKQQVEQLKKSEDTLKEGIELEYQNKVNNISSIMRLKLFDTLQKFMNELRGDNQATQEQYSYNVTVEGDRLWYTFWLKRETREEQRTGTRQVIYADHIKNAINETKAELINKLNRNSIEYIDSWRQELNKAMFAEIRSVNKNLFDARTIKNTVLYIINQVPFAKFTLDLPIPENIKQESGKLEDYDAEKFIAYVEEFIEGLEEKIRTKIDKYIKEVLCQVRGVDMAELLLDKLKKERDGLIHDIDDIEKAVDKYETLQKNLNESLGSF